MTDVSPEPEPLITVTDTTFEYAVLAPAQILVLEHWEQMVWDETLKAADERGVMLVGPVLTTYENYQRGSGARSASGKPFPPEPAAVMAVGDSDIVVLRGEATIGVAL